MTSTFDRLNRQVNQLEQELTEKENVITALKAQVETLEKRAKAEPVIKAFQVI